MNEPGPNIATPVAQHGSRNARTGLGSTVALHGVGRSAADFGRIELGLTQPEVGAALGITSQQLYKYELAKKSYQCV
jgi:hypothetical protein